MPDTDGGPTRGRPRAEPREEQRRRVLAAARAAFTEQGFTSVSISGVARAAGVPRAIVYEVVGTKDDLLGAIAEQVADELIADLDDHVAHLDPEAPLDDVVRGTIRFIFDRIGSDPTAAAMVQLSGRLAAHSSDPAGRARQRIEDLLTELHETRARSYGLERAATARVLSGAVLALVGQTVLRTAEEGWRSDAVADLICEFALGGYLRTEIAGTAQAFETSMTTASRPPRRLTS